MMNSSTIQSLIALVANARRDLCVIKDIMIGGGEIHYELADPLSPLGILNFKKLNLTLNEIRRVDRKIRRLDNILPELKKELKRSEVPAGKVSQFAPDNQYVVKSFSYEGRELTQEELLKFIK